MTLSEMKNEKFKIEKPNSLNTKLTDTDGPLISRKSMLRNKSQRTSSSTVGKRLSGDSKMS